MSGTEEQTPEKIPEETAASRMVKLILNLPKKTLEDLANPEYRKAYPDLGDAIESKSENSATISRSRKEQLSEIYNNQIKKIARDYDLTEKEVILLLKDQKEQESKKMNETELRKLFNQQVNELAKKYNLPENEVILRLRNQRLENKK